MRTVLSSSCVFFFQAEDGIRDVAVTGVQTCALPISGSLGRRLHLRGANDEVRRLAQAFDEMLDRIDGTLERERQFTANVRSEERRVGKEGRSRWSPDH